jgi:hypothetical protein
VLTDSTPGSVGDYAASIGTTGYDYTLTFTGLNPPPPIPPNGAFQLIDGLRPADFTDGLSNTLFFGEKQVPNGFNLVYPFDCNIYDGHNIICSTRAAGPGYALARGPNDDRVVFGGPHVGICQFAFADGSVRPIPVSISEVTLGLLAQRNDGLPVPNDF